MRNVSQLRDCQTAGAVLISFMLKAGALIALVIAANAATTWFIEYVGIEHGSLNVSDLSSSLILLGAYALIIAIPFVPAIEIGLVLLALGGPDIAFLVFLSTLSGLLLSFGSGRCLQRTTFKPILSHLNNDGWRQSRFKQDESAEGPGILFAPRAGFIAPFFLKHRYAALAIALNTPGNALIGGGGGIALAAGMCRIYSFPAFVLVTALAIAPIPFGVAIFGHAFLGH